MNDVKAWSIEVGQGRFAAIGERHLRHLVDRPQLFDVPHTPAACARVFVWNQAIIPVWDVPQSLGLTDQAVDASVLAIIAFQLRRDSPVTIAGIALVAPPVRIVVRDPVSCALPDPARTWKRIARSCFQHGAQVLPVLDFERMFGVEPDMRKLTLELNALGKEAIEA
jgi:chemotaxis signal transduction protein